MMMQYLSISFLVVLSCAARHIFATDWSAGQCASPLTSMSQLAKLQNPCSNVVNYEFYIPPGETAQTLENKANLALNDSNLLQFSSTCVSNVVAFQCSKIYLQCYHGVQLSVSSTYDYYTYATLGHTYGIPFYRPCGSVCNAVASTCGNFYLKEFGTPECTATYDYSNGAVSTPYPTRFDTTNNASQCFSPLSFTFAGMSEQYHVSQSAPCSGLVDTFVIPPASQLNKKFTFLQAPGVVQFILNQALSTQLATVPEFIAASCYNALLEYQCYSIFLKPITESLYQALVNGMGTAVANNVVTAMPALNLQSTYFTIPEFPAQKVCMNYATQCAQLLPLLQRKNPALAANCSATVPGTTTGAHKFPTQNQTIEAKTVATGVPSPATLVFKFNSAPNNNLYYNPSQFASTYQTTCPTGFVVPEDPSHADNQWVTGTGCAMSCISPIWNTHEWNIYRSMQIAFPIVGFILGLILLVFLVATQSLKETHMIFLFTIYSVIASIDSIYITRYTMEDAFCYDNAIEIKQHDDQPDSDSTACVAQGAILVYTYFAGCICMLFLVIDWRLRHYPDLYRKIEDNYQYLYWGVQFFCAVVLSLIPMLYAYVSQLLGFSRTRPWCYIRSYPSGPTDVDIAVMGIPILILVAIYFIIFCWNDLFGILAFGAHFAGESTKGEIETNTLAHRKSVYFAIAMVVTITVILYAPYLGAAGVLRTNRNGYIDSLTAWTQCVFQHYTNSDPDNGFPICGSHPGNRPPFSLLPYQLMSLTGNMLIIAPTYIISYIAAYFYNQDRPYIPVISGKVSAPVSAKDEDVEGRRVEMVPMEAGNAIVAKSDDADERF